MRNRARCGVVLVMFLNGASLYAQTSDPPRTMFPVPALPEIGLPLPQIGLPESVPGQPQAAPAQRAVTRQGEPRRQRAIPPVAYVLPPVLLVSPTPVSNTVRSTGDATVERAPARPSTLATETHPETGVLTLELQPPVAVQVLVDGYYIGSTDQIGTTIELPVGPHDMELKADGVEPVRFGVRIPEGRPLTYRETLHVTDSNIAAAPRHTPITLYVIPGCYAGNVEPDAAALPARCDISRLKTIEH